MPLCGGAVRFFTAFQRESPMRAIRQARRAERDLAFARQLPTLPVKNDAPPYEVGDIRHITGILRLMVVVNGT